MADEIPASQVFCESDLPFVATRIGAGAVYCSDGRYGDQIDDLLHHGLGLPAYDRLALPGGAACLAGYANCFFEEQALLRHVEFLMEVHQLNRLVLIAHENCAFYHHRLHVASQRLKLQQLNDLSKAAECIARRWRGLKIDAFFAATVKERVRFERSDT